MKERKIWFYLGVFWLLIICTLLSNSIERQMTVKVQVLEPAFSTSGEGFAMKPYSSEILSNGNLYEAGTGSEWDVGLRAHIVPPEFYITEKDQVLLPTTPGDGEPILYRTKELCSGAAVQKITPYQGKEDLYLTLSPKKEPLLSSMTGKEPYMENRQKEELGLLPEERLYSMNEVNIFSRAFPLLGLFMALFLSTLFLWLYNWRLSRNVKKNRIPLLMNGGILVLILLGIQKLAKALQMPSSLLPKENILDFKHYRETFGQILGALAQLQQTGNPEAGKLLEEFQQNLLLGCMAAILGISVCFLFIIAERRFLRKVT